MTAKSPPAAVRKKRSLLRSAGEVVAELRKVTWPSKQETVRLTILVLLICLALGIFLGGVDYGFAEFAKRFFGK